MLKDILARIEKRLKDVGLSATAASKQAGLSEDAIRNMRRAIEKDERQGVSTATIIALAPILQTTTSWLIDGVGSGDPPLVRIVGYIGADAGGEIIYATGQESWDMAPVPPGGTTDSVALLVKGHSMRTVAEDGALIYFEDQRTPPTSDMFGYPCVVETEDGRILFKKLLKGSERGVYDLESYNGPTIQDVRLKWAAEPTAIIPARQARRVIRRAGENQAA